MHIIKRMNRIIIFLALATINVLLYGQTATIDGITYSLAGNTASVTSASFSLSDVVVPSSVSVDGKTYIVNEIGNQAFRKHSSLKTIKIPNTITKIGSEAFEFDSYLKEIELPSSVISIGSQAFKETGLSSISIPNSVTTMGNEVFRGCSGLASVTLGTSISSIVSSTFENCTSLKSINIPISVTSIGDKAFYGCSGMTSITIPNSVTGIGDKAFEGCSGMTSITISNSVTSISDRAFYGCSGLTSITIPNSVTSIGYYAFWGCSSLTSFVVDSGNKTYCSIDGVLFSKDKSSIVIFPYGKNMSYSIPTYVKSIENFAFYGCSGLSSVIIPNSVTSIGGYAFYGCSGLSSVIIPSSVTSIETSAFYGCSGLTSLTIPNSVKSIGNYAFQNCSNLYSLTIPNSVTSIGTSAFSGCSGLTSLTIPNSVKSIGGSAFYGCSDLSSVIIPNSVTSIGSAAFSGCSGLSSVSIPNTVTSLEPGTFADCKELTTVSLGEGVKSIGSSCFNGCLSLEEIVIPENVTIIGNKCFESSGLKRLYNLSSVPQSISSNSLPTNTVVYVPTGSKEAYLKHSVWSTFRIKDENEADDPVLVDYIQIVPESAEINVGEWIVLTPLIYPDEVANMEVEWTSLDEDIAIVSDGVVLGVSPGQTFIIAKAIDGSDAEGCALITVKDIKATKIELDAKSISMYVGEKYCATATISPQDATVRTIKWSTSNPKVATISDGTINAVGSGTATITARTTDGSNLSTSCIVTVDKKEQTIIWNQSFENIQQGGELVELSAQSSSGLKIKYKSNDDNVAAVYCFDDAYFLNPIVCGITTIVAYQEGNEEFHAAQLIREVTVLEDPDSVGEIKSSEQKIAIYTLSGIHIGSFSKEEYDRLRLNRVLPKGLYVVNGLMTEL